MDAEILYQTEAKGFRDAAREFASRYWAQPRKVRDLKAINNEHATFGVKNGIRTYTATLTRGTYGPLIVISVQA